jgi:2-keto-3-deoxy-L-rhamnonate aldolase RhmA
MAMTLMYITNNPRLAQIAQSTGVDRIFVDLEQIGKQERQGGLDTVQSLHSIHDFIAIRPLLYKSELMVRTNPIYPGIKAEIEQLISAGADVLMLPFFKTAKEVETFINIIDGRAKVCLLVETPEAVAAIDDILKLDGIDEIHIGLNDLHMGYELEFMFELLVNGVVEDLCEKFNAKGIRYGFGGIAQLSKGTLSAKLILAEHFRLGSQMAILSRSFFNPDKDDMRMAKEIFRNGVQEIREYEQFLAMQEGSFFFESRIIMAQMIDQIKSVRKIQIAG